MMVHPQVCLAVAEEDHQEEIRTAAARLEAHLEMHMALARPAGGLVVQSAVVRPEVGIETHTVARLGVRLDISTMLAHPVVRPGTHTA